LADTLLFEALPDWRDDLEKDPEAEDVAEEVAAQQATLHESIAVFLRDEQKAKAKKKKEDPTKLLANRYHALMYDNSWRNGIGMGLLIFMSVRQRQAGSGVYVLQAEVSLKLARHITQSLR